MPEYVVESGDCKWRGEALDEDSALDAAMLEADGDLAILTRISGVNIGYWKYIRTEVVLKRIGLMMEDKE